MSLEQHIADNTAAIHQLIAVWGKLAAKAPSLETVKAEGLSAAGVELQAPAKVEKAEEKKPAVVSQPSETPVVSPASKPEASSPAPVTYDTVKALILKVSGSRGREVAAGVLAGLGVAKGPELKPEQFAAAAQQLEAALA